MLILSRLRVVICCVPCNKPSKRCPKKRKTTIPIPPNYAQLDVAACAGLRAFVNELHRARRSFNI